MFKKRLIVLAFVLLSLSSVAYIIFKVYVSKKTPTPVQNSNPVTKPADLSAIVPGTTTREEVIGKLGMPIKNIQTAGDETLSYNSTNKNLDSQIIIEKGVVVLVKEMVSYSDTKKVSGISKKYGVAIYSLFGPNSAGGSKLYIYPDKGIAYIGNPEFDALEEIWYFVPTSINDFKKKWAANYSEKEILNLY